MKRSKIFLFSVARWALLLTASLSLSACSTFVMQTQDYISSRPAPTNLTAYINKLPQVIDCVGKPGGMCPANDKTRMFTLAAPSGSRISPKDEANTLKSLMKKYPVTADTIKKGAAVADSRKGFAITGRKLPFDFVSNEQTAKAAVFAGDVLTDPTSGKLKDLYEIATGVQDPPPDNEPLTISRHEIGQYAKSIHQATNFNGWTSLRFHFQGQLEDKRKQSVKSSDDLREIAVMQSSVAQLTIVEAYLAAYFSNGNFVSIDFDATTTKAKLIKDLKDKLKITDEALAEKLAVKLMNSIIGLKPEKGDTYHLLTKATDGGFVTRGGTKYAFPGVSITIDPFSDTGLQAAKIDFTQVGADVVRVFLEAFGDTLGQLPADATSTACKAKKAGQFDKYPDFQCYDGKIIEAAQFASVNEYADLSESLAATATGQIIRGASWISLNNEALAKLIETAVGVIARKAAEKVSWCVFACSQAEKDKAIKSFNIGDKSTRLAVEAKAESDAKTAIKSMDDIQTIQISIGQ